MPDWPWPPEVVFDHRAAATAITTVASLRHELDRHWQREWAASQHALAGWEGMAAASFETSTRARGRATQAAIMELRRLQGELEVAVDDAHAAQVLVGQRRDEWLVEQRREQVVETALGVS